MIDPIKKFVEQNREAFDHMEPPADMLAQIKNRLKAKAAEEMAAADQPVLIAAEEEKTVRLFINKTKWMAAASILVAVTITFLYNDGTVVKPKQDLAQYKPQNDSKPYVAQAPVTIADSTAIKSSKNTSITIAATAQTYTQKFAATGKGHTPPEMLAQLNSKLADSTSASIRLAAILEIAGKNQISNSVLNSLSATLNNDNNSNVRLAALDVMGRYLDQGYVSSMLVQSLATQNDPYVQLGLINLLSKVNDVKIENRLFALAEDPNTTEAVKNEAYGVLLNQNKL
jgi:hypothetical protein